MNIEELSKIVSSELKMSEYVVSEINRLQWKFLHKQIQSDDFKPVGIMYIGKFSVKNSKAKQLKQGDESDKRNI